MSQLSTFLGGLWKDLEAPFVAAINNVKTAFASNNVTNVITSITGLIKVGAVAAENAATQAQTTGVTLTGPDKKTAVTAAVSSVLTPAVAQLTIPGVDSSTAQSFFGELLNGLVSIGIDAAVAELNKKGWTL